MGTDVRFDGRVAVVTGAGQGLGRSFALLLGARGASVIVNDLSGAAEVAQEIVDAGGTAVAHTGDIGQRSTSVDIVAVARSRFGRLDILINNAGVLVLKSFSEHTDEDLDRTLSVNVRGAWYLTHEAWAHMSAQGYGRVLMVSSMNGVVFSTPDHTAYGASKGALVGLTRELAFEGAPHGIQVNALMPGAVTTMLNRLSGYSSPAINLSPDLVAPVAGWLVHESCEATGMLVNASSARVGRVLSGVSEGYQGTSESFDLEAVRDQWASVASGEGFQRVDSLADYNSFRAARFADAGITA